MHATQYFDIFYSKASFTTTFFFFFFVNLNKPNKLLRTLHYRDLKKIDANLRVDALPKPPYDKNKITYLLAILF